MALGEACEKKRLTVKKNLGIEEETVQPANPKLTQIKPNQVWFKPIKKGSTWFKSKPTQTKSKLNEIRLESKLRANPNFLQSNRIDSVEIGLKPI